MLNFSIKIRLVKTYFFRLRNVNKGKNKPHLKSRFCFEILKCSLFIWIRICYEANSSHLKCNVEDLNLFVCFDIFDFYLIDPLWAQACLLKLNLIFNLNILFLNQISFSTESFWIKTSIHVHTQELQDSLTAKLIKMYQILYRVLH